MSKGKTCPMCGTFFTGRSNKIYCSAECAKKAKHKPSGNKRGVGCKTTIRTLSIEEIAQRARAEGMSYGQYLAKYYWS